MESAVDSSFFWGYLVTQVPGGFLASAFPANRIFGTAIACSAFLNLFLPGAFEVPGVIIIIRVMQGLVEVKRFLIINILSIHLRTLRRFSSQFFCVFSFDIKNPIFHKISFRNVFFDQLCHEFCFCVI